MKNIKYILLTAVLVSFTACNDEEDFEDQLDNSTEEVVYPDLNPGTADFSNYVAIGNSLTAGFTDNALFIASQENSMPNMLAQKFALAGGGTFTQPLMNDNIGGLLFGGNQNEDGSFGPRLYFDGSGPASLPGMSSTEAFAPSLGSQNNMGVPGAASFHLLYDGYGNPANLVTDPPSANPYFVRMASNPSATVLGDALAQQPTFVSLWIGNNDVLGYATSGGDATLASITPSDGPPGVGFDQTIETIVGALQNAGVQGVMANIPYVTTIPHFTTVPHNPLDPTNPDFGPQIPLLNSIFGALNPIFEAVDPNRAIVFSETEASAVVIRDESLDDISTTIIDALNASPTFPAFIAQFGLPAAAAPSVANLLGVTYGQTRQATADDLLVLPSSSVIGTVNMESVASLMNQGLPQALAGQFSVEGVSLPLEDKWVLLPTEQDEINIATDNFNATLEAAATSAGFAFVDANSLMSQLDNGGYPDGNFILTSSLVSGGAFSLDGVHPTARGYALLANQFMKAIDETYGSNFEASGNLLDIGNYPTNYPPTLQ
ncbi:G-D-S-L family lipolytic protein [Winogradskyella psychrotolerans]|uniref:G-D-S-L family lipolytic protein n=1 Tax=Winogradskyella psychrotolerans TaxID=1344585 RepID=UPI001C06D570|nr:G-D-S-L family lipolytic protein [Winogradskyella psychrotolerans]MBU2921829.1 G-D-S-L family lipolytic protein [Winogradskyella psychrotolerans]